jgi:O-antigen/teichoic acid export membrane protein
MGRPLALSSLRTIAIMATRIAVQGLTLILVTRLFGPTLYGGYIAAASLAVVMGLIPNLGSGYILMKRAASNPEAAGDVWSYGWPLTIGLGLLLSIAFPLIAHLIAGGVLSITALAIIGAVELLISPLTLLLSFVLQAVGRVPTGQMLLTLPLFLRMCAATACLLFPGITVTGFVITQAVAAAAGLMAALGITSRIVALSWKARRPSREELTSGSGYAAMHVVAANPTEFDKIVSPVLLDEHSAGIYSATSRIMNAVVMPMVGVLLAAQPRLFRHAGEPTEGGRKLIATLGGLAAIWGLIGGVAMYGLAPVIPLMLGNQYSQAAKLMPFVALAAPFVSLRLAAGTILVALGHPLQRLQFELAGVVALGSLLTIGSRMAGPKGMAVALSLAEFAMACYGWLLVRRALRNL